MTEESRELPVQSSTISDRFVGRRSLIRVWDVILIGLICMTALGIWRFHRQGEKGEVVHVVVGGESRMRIPLDTDTRVAVEGPLGPSIIRVQGGSVWIEEAPCPHKTCIQMGRIAVPGESIICIPNKIILTIEESSGEELDGVTM